MEAKINKISKPKLKKALFITSLMIIPLCSFAFFYVYMNFNSFFLAFQSIDVEENYSWVGFQNFADFFDSIKNSGTVGRAFTNSIKNFWITFIIDIPLYIILSYYLSKKMPMTKIMSVVVMLPSVVSTFVYAITYKKFVDISLINLMQSFGFENFPNLITHPDYQNFNNLFFCIWVSFGSATLIFTNAINAIDKEIIESSMIDGANDAVQFFKIVLPMIWPTFTTYIVTGLTSMFTWSGHLMTFYMYDAPPDIWGLGYYFTVTIKNTGGLGYMNYPMVATSGLFVTLLSVPIIFGARALMTKLDKTND